MNVMNDFFQENKRILFILIGFLALFALVLTFFILRPQINDLKKEEQKVAQAREQEKILQNQLDGLDDDPTNIDVEQLLLEKQVPTERNIDEYILSLQKLEQYANSHIEQVRFTYDSSIDVLDEDEDETDEATIQEAEEELTDEFGEDFFNEEQPPTFLKEIPEGLEVITVNVVAIVPSYEELVNLVRAIEDQDRISIVSRMRAAFQTDEEELFDDEEELIGLEFDVTTFYYAD